MATYHTVFVITSGLLPWHPHKAQHLLGKNSGLHQKYRTEQANNCQHWCCAPHGPPGKDTQPNSSLLKRAK